MTIEYSKDIEQIPGHLDINFFEEVLENAIRKSNIEVVKVKLQKGSSTGENYCSQIYRGSIQYKNYDQVKSFSIIIKSMPRSEATEFLGDLQVFLKEKIFYSSLLPLMEIFLASGQKFGARLYHTLRYPVNTLVFEDLSTSGYKMASRECGLDVAHSRLVMRKLGQFHGISMALTKKDADIMKFFNTGMLAKAGLEREEGMLIKYFSNNAAALVELIGSWHGYETITEKISKYKDNLRENLCHSQKPIAGEIKVLNHGDLWVNNILFKYDDQTQKLLDVSFVDFQMSIWGSPGYDLNYFFYTSLPLAILKTGREMLIKIYYDSLQTTLTELRYTEIPTLMDIKQEVQQRELYGFFATFGILPTISMDKEQCSDNNLDNFMDEDFARNKVRQMFASKRLQETLKYTLRNFNDLGIWDSYQ